MNTNQAGRVFFGIFLIGIGILFLLNRIYSFNWDFGSMIATFWPLIIIYFSFIGLFQHKGNVWSGSIIWNLLGLAIGGYFLARNLGFISISLGDLIVYVVPVLLILFGLRMMMKPSNSHHHYRERAGAPLEQAEEDYEDYSYGLGEISDANSGPTRSQSSFMGDFYLGDEEWLLENMNISHFIGDTVLDLTKAEIQYGETKLTISCFIGDIKIFVPNDFDLGAKVVSSSFLGDKKVFERREEGMFKSFTITTKDYELADKKVVINISQFIGDLIVHKVG